MTKIKNKKRNLYIFCIGWSLFILASATIVSYLFQGPRLFTSFSYYIKYASFGWALAFSGWLGNVAIGKYAEKKLDWTKNPKKTNIISLSIFIIYGTLIFIMIPYIYDRFIWKIAEEDIFLDVFIKALMLMSLDLILISIYYSSQLTDYWMKSVEKNEELKRENLLAKYEALKNQVNPHFLFNSLNTLSGVVEQKPELGTTFIKKLSDIYRYVLEQSDQEVVSISKEMKFVEDYIFLLKMRFGEALVFNTDLSDRDNIQIVPLGLQMLVENAIKHNIISDDLPLKIDIDIENDYFVVKNNFQQKNTVITKNEPLGLENLKKRYAYLSGLSIMIISTKNEFIVKLPIIEA